MIHIDLACDAAAALDFKAGPGLAAIDQHAAAGRIRYKGEIAGNLQHIDDRQKIKGSKIIMSDLIGSSFKKNGSVC